MDYFEIQVGLDPEPPGLIQRMLEKIFPAANPDIEQYIESATTWWIECNNNGTAIREIGFDKDRNPIVLGPVGRNYGFIVDSNNDWSEYTDYSDEAARDFERIWQELLPSFEHLGNDS